MAMATCMRRFQLCFPVFIEQEDPYVEATQLYHLLLPKPVAYDIRLDKETNFVFFLPGPIWRGRVRSSGAWVSSSFSLAHLGMGVPARSMRLTIFDGILSNINVEDNISKGESFSNFNEVQRIRNTLEKIGVIRRNGWC